MPTPSPSDSSKPSRPPTLSIRIQSDGHLIIPTRIHLAYRAQNPHNRSRNSMRLSSAKEPRMPSVWRSSRRGSLLFAMACYGSLHAQSVPDIPSDPVSAYDQAITVPPDPKAAKHYN